jgi:hypothetical protein
MYIVSMGVPIAVLGRIAAAVAAAAAAVSAWIWVKDLWNWLTGTPPPADAREKARILVAGPTGVGKTTLIRKIVGAPLGKVGEGRPQTPGIEWLGTTEFPIWFADSKGIETIDGEAQVDEIGSKIQGWNTDQRPHCAWLCVQADSARILGGPAEVENARRVRGTEGHLGQILYKANVPVLVVITQADTNGPELDAMRSRCKQVFDFPHKVVAICAEPITGSGRILIRSNGLDELRKLTLPELPSDLRARVEQAWQV